MVSKVSIEKRNEEYRASLEEFARKFDELLDLDMSDRAACCESLLNLAKVTNNRSIIRRAKSFIEEASNSDWEDATFKNKYTYLIDVNIRQDVISAEKVESLLKQNGGDYKAVAESLGESVIIEETGGLVDNKNIDGGRANIAASLKEGEQSGKFVSNNGDGYYFVKLISKTETQVNYISIKVPFTEFEKRFSEAKESGKITEYIEITKPEE